MGFDLKADAPEVPEHFKALCIGRMVRFVASGYVRPAVVVDVLSQAEGLVELHVFWGANRGEGIPIDEETGQAGVFHYDDSPEPRAYTWHWPPRAG